MNEMDQAVYQAGRKVATFHGVNLPESVPSETPEIFKGKYGFWIGLAVCIATGAYLWWANQRRGEDEGYDPEDAPRVL